MNQFNIDEHELSGARLTIPFTALGRLGPKHHAIIVGIDCDTQTLLVAELSRKFGYRLVSMEQWFADNMKYLPQLVVSPNRGPRSNAEVAHSAMKEVGEKLLEDRMRGYDPVFNNCETFAERHTKGSLAPTINAQVKRAMQIAGVVIATGVVLVGRRRV